MDPVANMLVAIKNAYLAKKNSVSIPYSKFKLEITKILEKENRVGKVKQENHKIEIELLYDSQHPKITQIERISKLGLRIYTKSKKIPQVKGGRGFVIISTPQGVMTGKESRQKKLGGEIICRVW